jgi:phosphate:Na+ symporter
MLGANLGTTLVVQLLSFNIGRVAPLFVLIGVILFRRALRLGRATSAAWRSVLD